MTDIYYNDLAQYYKYIYPDWDASVQRQARALDSIIKEFAGDSMKSILDVACGIGTQSIGLAKIGYQVEASDLSFGEVEIARLEAKRHNVSINFRVEDMRQVWEAYQRQFDILIACDNSIPHLLSENEILLTFRGFYKCTKRRGCCIISVRDYESLEIKENQKQIVPRLIHQTEKGQMIMFDVWDCTETFYEITTYILEDTDQKIASTQVIKGGKYFRVHISTLEKLFLEAGFKHVHTLHDRYFQPVLVALK